MSFGDELRAKQSTAPRTASDQEVYRAYLQYLCREVKAAIRRDTDEKLKKLPAGQRLKEISGDLPYYMKWRWNFGEKFQAIPTQSGLYRFSEAYDHDPAEILYPQLLSVSHKLMGGARVGFSPAGKIFVTDLQRELHREGITLTTRVSASSVFSGAGKGDFGETRVYWLKGSGMVMEDVPAHYAKGRSFSASVCWRYEVL